MKLTEYQNELLSKWAKVIEFQRLGLKTTACVLTLGNGFEIVGTSACVDVNDFDEEIGRHYAKVEAIKKLDELAGFFKQQTAAANGF